MNICVAIQITSTVLCCLIQLSVQSSSYDMFQKYMEISRQASDEMERSCSTFSDCGTTECCVAARRGTSRGVCMKRPSLWDEWFCQPPVLAVPALQEQHAQHIQQNNIQAENIRSGVNMSNMSEKKLVRNEVREM